MESVFPPVSLQGLEGLERRLTPSHSAQWRGSRSGKDPRPGWKDSHSAGSRDPARGTEETGGDTGVIFPNLILVIIAPALYRHKQARHACQGRRQRSHRGRRGPGPAPDRTQSPSIRPPPALPWPRPRANSPSRGQTAPPAPRVYATPKPDSRSRGTHQAHT